MKYKWLEQSERYDGTQLHSLYAYLNHGLLGDSVVSWRGPCHVAFEHMVDGEDKIAGATIAGDDMVHFIVEKFDSQILSAVGLQRILSALAKDVVVELAKALDSPSDVRREGDDLYFKEGKLSISIATQSPLSSLIHFAVNVTNEGTPVKTASLTDLKIDHQTFALRLMEMFTKEVESMVEATQKVHWVK